VIGERERVCACALRRMDGCRHSRRSATDPGSSASSAARTGADTVTGPVPRATAIDCQTAERR
jgi:hypothetical protein